MINELISQRRVRNKHSLPNKGPILKLPSNNVVSLKNIYRHLKLYIDIITSNAYIMKGIFLTLRKQETRASSLSKSGTQTIPGATFLCALSVQTY